MVSAHNGKGLWAPLLGDELLRRIARLRLVITDVDGVLTDGGSSSPRPARRCKRFSVRDGMGVERLREAGDRDRLSDPRENSAIVERRAEKLAIRHCHLGVADKRAFLPRLLEEAGVGDDEIAYIGDDVNDEEIIGGGGGARPHRRAARRGPLRVAPRPLPLRLARRLRRLSRFRRMDSRPEVPIPSRNPATEHCTSQGGPLMSRSTVVTDSVEETARVRIADKWIGAAAPVFVIAEIGINHNGSLDVAKRLIDGAILAGADAVKFQKRTPEKCVPRDQWNIERDTPWGRITYINYRRKMEFGPRTSTPKLTATAPSAGSSGSPPAGTRSRSTSWSRFQPPLLQGRLGVADRPPAAQEDAGAPGGRSSSRPACRPPRRSRRGWRRWARQNLLIAHATSSYPCPPEHLNLRHDQHAEGAISRLPHRLLGPRGRPGSHLGGGRAGRQPSSNATSRSIARCGGAIRPRSVEIGGLLRLVANIRDIERSLGDGVKRVYEGELAARKKLRRVVDAAAPSTN